MTKGGIHAFTRALAGNLLSCGIRVNCVAPGPVWTPLNPSDKQPEKVAHFGERNSDEAACPARGNRAGLCVPCLAAMRELQITGEIPPIVGGY